ncbi:MAG: hypothetical protein SGBAC_012695 [Bacillariaceae sp.]
MTGSQQGWREFNIYNNTAQGADGNNDQQVEDDEVVYASGMNLFGNIQEEEEEEDMHFSFTVAGAGCSDANGDTSASATENKKTIEVTLKGFSDYTQSTGMAVWLGSEIVATFMAQHPYLIRNKKVLELGSGLGLAGIVSHHLDSKKSILTDGDSLVLSDYLSFNAKMNDRRHTQVVSDGGGDPVVSTVTDDSTTSGQIGTMECHQLIWGHQGRSINDQAEDGIDQSPLVQFRKNHGRFDVILASDCTYMPQSVEPFWETIDFLLKRDDAGCTNTPPAKSPSTPKLLYVMEASTQAKFEDILDSAKRRGLEWTIDTMPTLEGTPQYEGKEHEIYTFWRSSEHY